MGLEFTSMKPLSVTLNIEHKERLSTNIQITHGRFDLKLLDIPANRRTDFDRLLKYALVCLEVLDDRCILH